MEPTNNNNIDQPQNVPVPPPSYQPDTAQPAVTPQPVTPIAQPFVSPPATTTSMPPQPQPTSPSTTPPQFQPAPVQNNPTTFTPTTPQPTQDNILPNVPTEWPYGATGKGLYKYSKQAVKLNLGPLLMLFIANSMISIGGNQIGKSFKIGFAATTIVLLIGIWLNAVNIMALIDSVDGKKASLGRAFGRATSVFLKIFVATILSYIAIIIGFILLIIPGFIVLARLSLTHYYIVDQKLGPIAAIKASLAATKGNIRKIFQIWSLNILIALLIFTIIGIPFAVYFWFMFSAATAIAYRYLGGAGPNHVPQSAAESPLNPSSPSSAPSQLPPDPTA